MTESQNIQIGPVISVKDLADKLQQPVTKLIGMLLKNGIMATINESLDFETAAIISEEFGFTAELDRKKDAGITALAADAVLNTRPPVVTIMGHVDHGKTTLLDTIRETEVAKSESGGITQHIGAYQVTIKGKGSKKHHSNTITFLDTPGHAAFSALRQHGANITDIVILVIAANDGIKAQTIEALDHAHQANVPIIVAITKIDLPDANIERIKQQLAELEMVPEDWGGKTIIVPVSAKTKQGLDDLLEMILLVADLENLQARADGAASGVIVESHLEPGRGPVATVLIQNGQLNIGDAVTVGGTSGKLRTLENYRAEKQLSAGPSEPVVVSGLRAVPNFGEQLIAMSSEKQARDQATQYSSEHRQTKVHSMASHGLDESVTAEPSLQHELSLVVKADVKGSLEAVKKVLDDLGTAEASIKISTAAVGPVNESDVTHAKATKSIILAFRVPVTTSIRNLAAQEKVAVSSYDVIYDLVEDARKALSKLLPPEVVEVPVASAKVIALFKGDKRSQVVGVQIEEGTAAKGALFHLRRKKDITGEGTVLGIRRGKDEVKEVGSGQQAGLSIPGTLEVAEGDFLDIYRIETRTRTI